MFGILKVFSTYFKVFFRFILFPILILLYFLGLNEPGTGIYRIIYIIGISALVGYWTNYFAIKMLFRPKEKTLLGFQGIVPANKSRIAADLGRVVKDKFFNTEDIIKYIEEKELIKKFFDRTKDIVAGKLKDRELKKKIIVWINEKFNAYSPKLYVFLIEKTEFLITRYFSKSFSPEKTIHFLTDFVETHIESGKIDLNRITDAVVSFVERNIPEMSNYLYNVLEKEIEQSSLIKKVILRAGTYILDINPSTIKDQLKKAVNDREFRKKVYEIITQVVADLGEYLNREEVRSELKVHIKTFQEFINTTARDNLIPAILDKINAFLSKDESWSRIENVLDSIIDFSSRELEKVIASREFSEFIKNKVPELLEKFDVESLVVEKAKKFNTDQIEEVVLHITGEQLSYIEILGGILGGLAGIAIFDLEIFFLVFGCVSLLLLFDFVITRFSRERVKEA